MIETLETRRLLSALPVNHDPVDAGPRTVRIVTLEEFLGMESWNDDEIVVEWYSQPSESGEGDGSEDDDGDWQVEVEEEMSDVCDGGPMEEALDDEDFALVEEWDVLEQPIVVGVNDDDDDDNGGSSFNDDLTIGDDGDDVLGSDDDNDDDQMDLLA